MYQNQAAQQERQAKEDAQKAYQTDEELKRQFEEWKKGTFQQYNKEAHDEFLKNRYYRYQQTGTYDTNDHFSHPNAQTGPENYQEVKGNAVKEPLSEYYRRKAEDQDQINQ